MLVGREHELARLDGLVDQARRGAGGGVVLVGEPGVGKTALLDHLAGAQSGSTVLRTQGLQVEAPLAFAALHRLLRPVTHRRDVLAAPQARALRVAFGEEDGPSVEPFLVGVATLTLLTAAAEERLVLCLVDDAHWLDPASADALLFCARRVGADRVVMVFAARDGESSRLDGQGLAPMQLAGLGPDDARSLLDQHLGDAPTSGVAARLVSETRGNPLALLELTRGLSPDQLRGAAPLPTLLSLTARLERVFLERSRGLPPEVQTVLLLAAADDTGEPAVLRAALRRLGIDEGSLEDAVTSGLLVADAESVTVRHPIVRSAIYQAATAAERRSAHDALGRALAGFGSPDREAWHRAAAADGPDPEVAAALELAGLRAERRGGHVSALAAYERAAALSPDPTRRADLTFAAARSAWACGEASHAQALLAAASDGTDEPTVRCDIASVRGHIEVNLGSASLAHRIFVDAAHAVHDVDRDRALDLAVRAAIMRTYGADSGTRLPSGDLLVRPLAGDLPRTVCLQQLMTAMTLAAEQQWAGAVAALDLALDSGAAVDDREVLWNLGNAALQLGDDRAQQHFYAVALSRARDAGAVTGVVYALQRLCFGYFLAGDVVAVRGCAEEALSLSSSIRQPAMTALPLAWLTLLAALQGRDAFDDLERELDEVVTSRPLGILTDPVHDVTRWAKGVRAAGAGDSAGALHHLTRFRLPALARMAAVERIDAAARAGEPHLARDWVEQLGGFAESTRRPWALGAVAYGRAATGAPTEAEAWFEQSLAHYRQASRPLDEARVLLAYGGWLRRAQRRVDARGHLRRAVETFQDAHADALVDRAVQELRASGETARKRDPSTLLTLTPMERKVTQLVTSGLSNKEVAAQCWVSPRTVAFHLRNVVAKTGVTSRGELARLDLG